MKTPREFCSLLNLEEEITEDIACLGEKISFTLGDKILLLAKTALKDGTTVDEYQQLLRECEAYGNDIGEHKFRMQMMFAYYCFALLEEKYERAGIDKSVYNETMLDFKFRVHECRDVYHFTGIFVAEWYYIFCNLCLHKIDELEFERTVSKFEYQKRRPNNSNAYSARIQNE